MPPIRIDFALLPGCCSVGDDRQAQPGAVKSSQCRQHILEQLRSAIVALPEVRDESWAERFGEREFLDNLAVNCCSR